MIRFQGILGGGVLLFGDPLDFCFKRLFVVLSEHVPKTKFQFVIPVDLGSVSGNILPS